MFVKSKRDFPGIGGLTSRVKSKRQTYPLSQRSDLGVGLFELASVAGGPDTDPAVQVDKHVT